MFKNKDKTVLILIVLILGTFQDEGCLLYNRINSDILSNIIYWLKANFVYDLY
jgi:hypothetical protein